MAFARVGGWVSGLLRLSPCDDSGGGPFHNAKREPAAHSCVGDQAYASAELTQWGMCWNSRAASGGKSTPHVAFVARLCLLPPLSSLRSTHMLPPHPPTTTTTTTAPLSDTAQVYNTHILGPLTRHFAAFSAAAMRRLSLRHAPRCSHAALYTRRESGGALRRPTSRIAAAAVFPSCRPTIIASESLATSRRCYMPLPQNQDDFSAYTEIDLPTETRIDAIRRTALANQEWVACEKVHGTNFAIYLLNESEVRFAKRSGIMDPNENFFGYHLLIDDFTAQVRALCELLKRKYGVTGRMGRVVLHGELFGAKYTHPLVPKSAKWCILPNKKRVPISGVEIQSEAFPQYSPELHYFAFDIKYSVSGAEEAMVLLPFDDFTEVCSQVPHLLYAKPLVRGTLDECLAFDVENFITPLPALLGLGNYPLEGNLAEGVVIRHVRRGDPAVECSGVSTIIKLRCSSFMELKHPGKQQELKATFLDTVRAGALQRMRGGKKVTVLTDAMLPKLEAAANALLLNNVSKGRLNNVLSKIGREPLLSSEVQEEDVVLMLAQDALKDFLKETDPVVLNTSLSFRKALIRSVYFAAEDLLRGEWKRIMERERASQTEIDAAIAALEKEEAQ